MCRLDWLRRDAKRYVSSDYTEMELEFASPSGVVLGFATCQWMGDKWAVVDVCWMY